MKTLIVKIEWILYKIFKIKRNIPCGRTKKSRYLCCCQPMLEKYCYYNSDRTKVYCKCCDSMRMMSSKSINNIKKVWWE